MDDLEDDDVKADLKGGANERAVAVNQLKAIVERIENINDDIASCTEDRKELYKEAKGNGFDTKAIRRVVRLRAMEKAKRDEERAMTELYLDALGML